MDAGPQSISGIALLDEFVSALRSCDTQNVYRAIPRSLKGNEYHLQTPPTLLNFRLKLKYNCSNLSTSYINPNRFLEFVNDENVTRIETSWKEFGNDHSKIIH